VVVWEMWLKPRHYWHKRLRPRRFRFNDQTQPVEKAGSQLKIYHG
jgi:hypothetical protein